MGKPLQRGIHLWERIVSVDNSATQAPFLRRLWFTEDSEHAEMLMKEYRICMPLTVEEVSAWSHEVTIISSLVDLQTKQY